jgi:uncharacterized protein (TIGR04255 family)
MVRGIMSVPKLTAPPINEVVCGFIFQPMPELTPQVHGIYWDRRRDTFAACQPQVTIVDEHEPPVLLGNPSAIRTWLVCPDETRLVQLQCDRFYANWRRKSDKDEYPRFSPNQAGTSLLQFALQEYERFSEFCSTFLNRRPRLTAVDLSKIDILRQGDHYSDTNDLAKLVPSVATLITSFNGSMEDVVIRISGGGTRSLPLTVNIASGIEKATNRAVLRIETRGRSAVQSPADLERDFLALNEQLNGTFFSLLARGELHRFHPEVPK